MQGLPRPDDCTEQLYTLVLKCWETDPDHRISFADICKFFMVPNTGVQYTLSDGTADQMNAYDFSGIGVKHIVKFYS